MIAPARVAAYEILLAVSAGRADLPAAIARSRAALDDDRDRALAAAIATGVQRWRAALDRIIEAFAKRPVRRLDPEVVEILRLSVYQLLHLARVPASAVVDDAVKLVRRAGKRSADGFVNAVLRTVLFRDTMPGFQLKDGDHVLAHGRVTIYPQRGELQFVCDFVRPEGVGIIAAKFEELRERLGREGLFAPDRKRSLPRFPRTIGVVTSPTGAALQDVRNVLERRWPMATLVLARTAVQGVEAPAEIAAALRLVAEEPGLDAVILARGGRSIVTH